MTTEVEGNTFRSSVPSPFINESVNSSSVSGNMSSTISIAESTTFVSLIEMV